MIAIQSFFIALPLPRKKQDAIHELINDDEIETMIAEDMEPIATNYFQNLFTSQGEGNLEHLLSGVSCCIFYDINQMLIGRYSTEEIFTTLRHMGPTKALRIDDFRLYFTKNFWHIVVEDATSFCLGILNEGQAMTQINVTNIFLIPKMTHPKHMVNFRPISLCNVIYKSIARAMANRF